MLRVGIAEGNIAARRNHAGGGRECEQYIFMRAIINARGLEEESVWRIKENWENLCRGQAACEIDVCKRSDDDERGNEQGENRPRAKKCVSPAQFTCALFGKPALAACAEDGGGLAHVSYLTTKGSETLSNHVTCNDTLFQVISHSAGQLLDQHVCSVYTDNIH